MTMVEPRTYLMPEHGWTCFHCGSTFITPAAAREHFGDLPTADPSCKIKLESGDRGIIRKLRWRERQVASLVRALCTGSCFSRGCNCPAKDAAYGETTKGQEQ